MLKKNHLILIAIGLAFTFGITACAETRASRANLKRIKYNKEWEMRQNWNDYTVYAMNRPSISFQRGVAAFLYELKDDKTVIMDRRWIPVKTEEQKANTRILEAVISAEILGHNEELYGYLIYRAADRPNVRIIDEKTVQLFYHYGRNYGN